MKQFLCSENVVSLFSACSCCSRTWRPTSTRGRSAGTRWVQTTPRRCSRSSSGNCPLLCSPPSTSTPSALSEVGGHCMTIVFGFCFQIFSRLRCWWEAPLWLHNDQTCGRSYSISACRWTCYWSDWYFLYETDLHYDSSPPLHDILPPTFPGSSAGFTS